MASFGSSRSRADEPYVMGDRVPVAVRDDGVADEHALGDGVELDALAAAAEDLFAHKD
jgi:hypothetical protein